MALPHSPSSHSSAPPPPPSREDLVRHCEAVAYDNQCRKLLTAMHRLRDRLQAEISYQRRSGGGGAGGGGLPDGLGSSAAAAPFPQTSFAYASPSPSASSTSRCRSGSGHGGSRAASSSRAAGSGGGGGLNQTAPISGASSQQRGGAQRRAASSFGERLPTSAAAAAGPARGRGPTYGWVLLRRINLRAEKLRTLGELVEDRMVLLEGEHQERCRAAAERREAEASVMVLDGGASLMVVGERSIGGASVRVHTTTATPPRRMRHQMDGSTAASTATAAEGNGTSAATADGEEGAADEDDEERLYRNEMLILGHVLRTARLSLADFGNLEGQAMNLLCGL